MRLFRRSRCRLVSVGSIPPAWGGTTSGGVATFHEAFLREIPRHRAEVVGVLPTNLDPQADDPAGINCLRPEGDEREWYLETLDGLAPDAVKFFHVGHRWALWHVEHSDIPAVGSIHSWHQITHRPPDQSERARGVLQAVLKGIDALIFPSRHTCRQGEDLGLVYDCPTYVIPNHLHQRVAAAPLSRQPRNGIVFAGSLIPRKRADLVVRAAADLDLPATILGDGPERLALERLAREVGASVRFLGGRPIEDVIGSYQSAKVLCVPSDSESFGNVYLEAAACGTPSVGFAPTLAEIADHVGCSIGVGVSGTATAGEVTAAVDRVLSAQWDRRMLREHAARLSPARTVGGYLDVLTSAS